MKSWIVNHKRRYCQLIAAVLLNANITGFFTGSIYQGRLKCVCTPGLNCYSCPGAVTACPLGSLQNALAANRFKGLYYVIGTLLLFGIVLGRLTCGFICPFGLLQELLYKIPSKKVKKGRITVVLSKFKYVVLGVMVIGIPLILKVPGFCKWLCPQGTLEGGILLAIRNVSIRRTLGLLFSWKVFLLASVLLFCIFCFRSFCRFICPLGAFYSLFAGKSIWGMQVDEKKCNSCGQCIRECRMDVNQVGDMECIGCMDCAKRCPREAISLGISRNL